MKSLLIFVEDSMQSNRGKRSGAFWARGFAAVWAMLAAAAGGSALAAPVETVLHSFTGSDGSDPTPGLIADSSGNLYGTTQFGGAPGCGLGFGCGVVFKLSPGGGPRRCCTPLRAAATGGFPMPA